MNPVKKALHRILKRKVNNIAACSKSTVLCMLVFNINFGAYKFIEESTRSTLAATASNSEGKTRWQACTIHADIWPKCSNTDNYTVNQIPDTLSKELADLRFAYAKLLRSYEKELQRSPEAQKEFVEFLPRLLRRNFSLDQTFQLLFDKLIEKEVSLFNIHYLKRLCSIFPEDVWWGFVNLKMCKVVFIIYV